MLSLRFNLDDPSAPLYSNIKKLETFRRSGRKFMFGLKYPEVSSKLFIWQQTDNPFSITSKLGSRSGSPTLPKCPLD